MAGSLPLLENGVFIILIIAVVLLIIIFKFYFSKKAIIKRKLRKAELKSLSSFTNGDIAKIVGEVEFVGEHLIAPLSGRACCHYYVNIEKKVSSGKNSYWKTIIKDVKNSKFVIREGYKYAVLNTMDIKSYIVMDSKSKSGFMDDATIQQEEYLKSHGHDSTGLLGFNNSIRYNEGILEEGEKIAVLGKGEWKYTDQTDLPSKYDRVLEISAADGQQVYLSDDPDTLGPNKITKQNKTKPKRFYTD